MLSENFGKNREQLFKVFIVFAKKAMIPLEKRLFLPNGPMDKGRLHSILMIDYTTKKTFGEMAEWSKATDC